MLQFYTIYEQKFSNLRPFLQLLFFKESTNLKFFNIGLKDVEAKRRLKRVNTWKKSVKNLFFCCGNFTPFMSKGFQIWDHLFPLLFPKVFQKSKKFAHWTMGSVGKRPLKGVIKTNTKNSCWVRQNLPQNKLFIARWFYTFYESLVFETLIKLGNLQCKSKFNRNEVLFTGDRKH